MRARSRNLHSVSGSASRVALAQWVDGGGRRRPGNTAEGARVNAGRPAATQRFEAQERAARRIAQSLHDDTSQMLAVVYLELAGIARECPKDTTRRIEAVARHLDDVCEHIRELSHELRPVVLENFGLGPALQDLADGIGRRFGLPVAVSGDLGRLSPDVEMALYRVVQEALSNAVRHACATRVDVRLWEDPQRVHCTVHDNGVGMRFDAPGRHRGGGLGLVGIRERLDSVDGSCTLTSRDNDGLEMAVEIPR